MCSSFFCWFCILKLHAQLIQSFVFVPDSEPLQSAMKHAAEPPRQPTKGEALLVGKQTMRPVYSRAVRAAFGILVGKASQAEQQLQSMPVPKLQLCQKLPPARQPLENVMPQAEHTGDSLHGQVISQGAFIGPGFSSSLVQEESCHDLHGQPLVPMSGQMPAEAFSKKAAALRAALPKQWAQPVATRPTTTAHSVNMKPKSKYAYARPKPPPRTPRSKAVGCIEQNSVLEPCGATNEDGPSLELCRATSKGAGLMMQLEAAIVNLMGLEKRYKECLHVQLGDANPMMAAMWVQMDKVLTLTWELRAASEHLSQLEALEANRSAQGAT